MTGQFLIKRYCILFSSFLLPFLANSQKAHFIKMDELNDRISKGKDTLYIINFWATWCSPCVKELPSFDELNKHFKSEKLKVLLISVDFKSKLNTSVAAYLTKKNIKSEVFLLDEKNQQEYIDQVDKSWSGAIPATLFIKQNNESFLSRSLPILSY